MCEKINMEHLVKAAYSQKCDVADLQEGPLQREPVWFCGFNVQSLSITLDYSCSLGSSGAC